MSAERLQKVLAAAGIASRRDCEELIRKGRVSVNGRVMRELGARVDPEVDVITVDGQPVLHAGARTYLLLYKPVGYVSTADDPQGRATVIDLIRDQTEARVFPVGRLDLDSEGLLLLTDDGDLAYRLTHPSFEVEKEYRVLLNQAPSPEALRSWREGVELDGQQTAPAWVEVLERADKGVWVRVVLREGRKRQVREVAALLGYEVLRLIRVREGTLTLDALAPGASRMLSEAEVEALRKHAAAEARGAGKAGAARRGAEAGQRSEREAARSGAPKRIAGQSEPVRSRQSADDDDADAFADDNRGNDRRADRQPQRGNSSDARSRSGIGYSRERSGSGYPRERSGSGYPRERQGGNDQRERTGGGYSRERPASGYSRERSGSGYPRERPASGYSRERPGGGYSRERSGSGYPRERTGGGYSRERAGGSDYARERSGNEQRGRPGNGYSRERPGNNEQRGGPRNGYGRERSPTNRAWSSDPRRRNDDRQQGTPDDLARQRGDGERRSGPREYNQSGPRNGRPAPRQQNYNNNNQRGSSETHYSRRRDDQDRGQGPNGGARREVANSQSGPRRPARTDTRPGAERDAARPRRSDTAPRSTPRPRPEADEDDE